MTDFSLSYSLHVYFDVLKLLRFLYGLNGFIGGTLRHQFELQPESEQTKTQAKPLCHEKAYLTLSPTMKLARCFIGLRARLPSGICHQSIPSLYAKVSLFGLIRGVLPIFSQVPVLLNQELDSCFPWQTQGPGCPELPLADGVGGRGGG